MTNEQQGKQYEEYLQFAIELAKKASEMIRAGQMKRNSVDSAVNTKSSPLDFLTETDLAVEKFIKNAIAEKYPEHKFVGAEGHVAGSAVQLEDNFTWIVDPIDDESGKDSGFTKDLLMRRLYRHHQLHSRLSHVGCSIGMTHKKQPVVGVVAMPLLHQIFYGRLGGGAYMNGTPLPLTGKPQPLMDLSAFCVCLEWGSNRTERVMGTKLANARRLAMHTQNGGKQVHGIRIVGCTTGALILVAAGSADVQQ